MSFAFAFCVSHGKGVALVVDKSADWACPMKSLSLSDVTLIPSPIDSETDQGPGVCTVPPISVSRLEWNKTNSSPGPACTEPGERRNFVPQ